MSDPNGHEEHHYRLDDISDDDPDLLHEVTYIDRILDAYANMRASTAAFILTRPSEARLLFLALLSDVIFFLARSISMVVAPPAEIQASLPEFVGLGILFAFLFRTALFYLIAILAKVISVPFGGKGSWYATRCGVFWAALVSAPIELVGALMTLVVVNLREDVAFLNNDWLVEMPYFLGPIAFGFFFSAGIAQAQGFKYNYKVMAVVAVLGFALIYLAGLAGLYSVG
ncbi:MAG: hypothetical protein ACPGGK_04580 [Pikeienuella sp.]